MRVLAITSSVILSILLGVGCGKKQSKDDDQDQNGIDGVERPGPPPLPVPVDPIPVAPSDLNARIFVASGVTQSIAIYKGDGQFLGFIDLTKFGVGFVTAMTWLDQSNLLAFFDPGGGLLGEKIIKFTFSGDSITSYKASWYVDPNLTLVDVPKMFSGGFKASPYILIAKNSASLEAIETNADFSQALRSGNPYITTSSACPISGGSYVSKTPGGDRTLIGNGHPTSQVARINIFDENNACLSSYNFGTTFPSLPTATVSGIAASQDSVFVRYSHQASPTIAKCAFDGTALSGCFSLVSDPAVLGLNRHAKEMVFGVDTNTLLVPNWDTGTIMQVHTSSGHSVPFIKDMFSSRVLSISIRP